MPFLQQPIKRSLTVSQTPQLITKSVGSDNVNEQLNTSSSHDEQLNNSTTITTQQPQKVTQKPQSNAGRPEVIDDAMTQQFIALFQAGWSERKACEYLSISTNTLLRKKRVDPEFLRHITFAKSRHLLLAGDRITKVLENGMDRDAVPIAKWLYEKHMPEIYGNVTIEQQNNTQNNIYVLDNNQLSNIRQQSDVSKTSPAKLLEALETRSELDTRGEEGSTTSVRPEEVQSEYSQDSDMPQPSSPI